MFQSVRKRVCLIVWVYTLREMLIVSASMTLNTCAVNPSPRSLASQYLHGKTYMMPLVGTATVNTSTNQQLSAVAPSCPNYTQTTKKLFVVIDFCKIATFDYIIQYNSILID